MTMEWQVEGYARRSRGSHVRCKEYFCSTILLRRSEQDAADNAPNFPAVRGRKTGESRLGLPNWDHCTRMFCLFE